MPKIQYNKSGGKIIYDSDDWLAGIEKIQASSGYNSKGNGLTASGTATVDTLRQLGYITVGYNPADVTNIAEVTGMIKNGVVYGDNAYLIATDKVHELNSLATGVINTTAPFPHTIAHGAHTGETGSDCVNYYVGAVSYMFYSFYDTTDWDVGAYAHVGDTFTANDAYMSVVAASPMAGTDLTDGKDIEHPMIVGDDDVLYMGSGRHVHAFDGQVGADGTFYSKVLTLPVGWKITSFAKLPNNKLAIGAYYSTSQGASTYNKGSVKIWVWGYLELDIETSYTIDDNYISELFNWNGTLACFTDGGKSISKLGSKKLQVFDGTKFVPIVEWNSGSLPIRGGVDLVGTDIYWNSSGIIYSFTKIPNSDAYAFNYISGDSGASGMLKLFTQLQAIHLSDGSGATRGLKICTASSGYREAGTANCKPAFINLENGKKGKVTSVSITFLEAVTGGRAFSLNTSIDGDWSAVWISSLTVVTDLKIKLNKRSDGTDLGTFTRINPVLVWIAGDGATKAPTVERIEYEFEYINL